MDPWTHESVQGGGAGILTSVHVNIDTQLKQRVSAYPLSDEVCVKMAPIKDGCAFAPECWGGLPTPPPPSDFAAGYGLVLIIT